MQHKVQSVPGGAITEEWQVKMSACKASAILMPDQVPLFTGRNSISKGHISYESLAY